MAPTRVRRLRRSPTKATAKPTTTTVPTAAPITPAISPAVMRPEHIGPPPASALATRSCNPLNRGARDADRTMAEASGAVPGVDAVRPDKDPLAPTESRTDTVARPRPFPLLLALAALMVSATGLTALGPVWADDAPKSSASSPSAAAPGPDDDASAPVAAPRLLVGYLPGTSAAERDAIHQRAGGTVVKSLLTAPSRSSPYPRATPWMRWRPATQ